MPENDKIVNLEFPEGGVDQLREFQEQEPGTTPRAENVRFLNADTLRSRGGSRPGLIRYVPDRIPADTTLSLVIQHLNVIVDPQAEALQQTFVTPGDDWVADPLNPGFYVPPGGWGYQPNPNAPPPVPPSPPAGFFVQKIFGNTGVGSTPTDLDLTLSSAPTVGSVIAVWAYTQQNSTGDVDGDLAVSVSVVNGVGAAYTQRGTYVVAEGAAGGSPGVTTYRRMSLWTRVVTSATNDRDVTITPNPDSVADPNISTITVQAGVVEYAELDTATPFQSFSKNQSNPAVSSLSTGSAAGDSGDLAIAALFMDGGQSTPAGLTDRGPGFGTFEVYDATAAGSTSVTFTFASSEAAGCAVAVLNQAP